MSASTAFVNLDKHGSAVKSLSAASSCAQLLMCRQGRVPSPGGEGERAGGRERSHRGGRSRPGLSGCDGHHEGLRPTSSKLKESSTGSDGVN